MSTWLIKIAYPCECKKKFIVIFSRLSFLLCDVIHNSCPFDFVKVYDGPDNSSELIGTYCGQQRNLVLYSSESSLLVHFFTLRRTASTQNRGFKGIYEFSESFVKLDFIRKFLYIIHVVCVCVSQNCAAMEHSLNI